MTNKFYKLFHSIDYGLLIAIIIPIIGILPTLGEGLANGADAPFHAHRIYALSELIQSGNLYPRWVTYLHMGYGYPIFNFYPPGATHIGAWFHLFGFDVVTAYNLTNALAWSIGSVGIYLLARTFLPIRVALLACVLWVVAPSRFFEFWWQGSLAQIIATSFIPLVFYGIIRTSKVPILKNSLWIAIPFATIIFTHIPTTYMTALFVAPLCIIAPLKVVYDKKSLRIIKPNVGVKHVSPLRSISIFKEMSHEILRRWLFIGSGLAISAGLSAIFLLPVLAEVQFIEIAGDLPDTVEFLRQKFGTFSEIFSIPQIIDSTDATLVMPRALGLIGGILSIIGFIALLSRKQIAIALFLMLGLGFAVFLATEPSLDVWLWIPSFRNLRFPERILRIGAVFIALLGASSLLFIPKRWQSFGLVAISTIIILQALPIMHPRDDDRIWENLSAVDEITMEFQEHNWGTTAYDEYEPYWGEVTPLDMPPDVESYINNPFQIRILESDAIRKSDHLSHTQISNNQIKVITDKDITIRFRQFYFPGWQMIVDGEHHPITPDERFGLIKSTLPKGEHIVQLEYVGTPIQHLSTLISIITAIGCIVIIWRSKTTPPAVYRDENPISSQSATLFIGGIFVFAIINVAGLQDTVFRIHSPADTPHYMQTLVNVTFDDNVTLLGYTLDSDTISSDNPLGIRFYWRIENKTEKDYRPVIQLVNLNVSESWAVSQPLDFEGGKVSKLSPNKFMSDRHELELFDDVPPYVGQISIQLLQSKNKGIITTLPDGNDRVILPDRIRIETLTQPYQGESSQINFSDRLTLHCAGLKTDDSYFNIDLWWQVNQSIDIDYKIFIHGLNAQGEIVQQADRFLLDGQYPSSYWQLSQTLNDTIKLDFDQSITTIMLGLYNPDDSIRVPVTIRDTQSDHITLPVEERSCTP
jgi:hypothetical protein